MASSFSWISSSLQVLLPTTTQYALSQAVRRVTLLFKLETYRPYTVGIFTLCKNFCNCSGWSLSPSPIRLAFSSLLQTANMILYHWTWRLLTVSWKNALLIYTTKLLQNYNKNFIAWILFHTISVSLVICKIDLQI